MKNKFRQALLDRRPSFGGWISIADPAPAEIFARLGFEWAAVDLEHGGLDLESLTNIFRALDRFGCVPAARLPWCDPVWIKRSLDAGAQAVIVPMVNTAAQARRAVAESKYPPQGRRGFGFCRANLYGLDFGRPAAELNDEIAVIVQIEQKEAIGNLDAILSTPGVDGALLGPYDLSGSFGNSGEFDSPEMNAAVAVFLEACRRHGKAAGLYVADPAEPLIRRNLAAGYTFLALGVDTAFLAAAARQALDNARNALSA
jgi:2-keto-3-deoxy-L-rhamnonate aldolase RhmA